MSKKLNNTQLVYLLKGIRDLQAQQKELEEQITYMEDMVKAHMAEIGAEAIDTGVYRVSWKTFTQNRLDTSKLKAERNDIYQEFVKPVEYKRFQIS